MLQGENYKVLFGKKEASDVRPFIIYSYSHDTS